MNFLRNSIDAIGDRSQHPRDIVLRTELAADRALRLSVEDTGCGIGSAEADQLFDAFHTTKADGMGIGLSISRSIVEAHGGEIWGRSNPEIGATFGFSIPDTSEQLLNDGDKAFPAGRS
jgi:signal transduction histidine kinase